ncbi:MULTISPECIES: sulfotransferase family 2 domain-containing protein [Sulfitobacter]|uniref:sulfotransferase family 2 domain-containing protein n=1 Tax=Sulfitobacter TaxID=60136 RepID=UPI0023075488|nr:MULTISPECIES: sulfotransferase family 2 domain-containing protein [Sulfitobacter]MDF3382355.1 sulfotransferase family 2 domain-containing protein [Sulfitobacter sp. Ks11]MDF3385774.1 sulfotransferase family 2 domain-containing protein [Sulfitobacter sp. M85]MDF3389193.1 sulfotransferase family 2 domain-containing protein [Sulfitobacter sp. Ks16]MDF3399830.1 sulfotransferase family 2 domain-containing protein [Sulfitobacter sp. KE39]MDF3403251.1 sulfotransferase family 2 domain-containing pr
MIISRGRRYVFVHIPKTGGTSLALALEDRAMKDDVMLGDTPKARKRRRRVQGAQAAGRLWKHSTLADIDGLVRAEELDDLFCFTLVRNPWDRVASYYRWLRGQGFDHPAVALAKATDFAGFLRHPQTQASLRAWPARRYMQDAAGRERCDLYIRLEHFAQDAAPLFEHLGFELDLPRVNASEGQAAYTPELRDLVSEICAEDIARFGYVYQEH